MAWLPSKLAKYHQSTWVQNKHSCMCVEILLILYLLCKCLDSVEEGYREMETKWEISCLNFYASFPVSYPILILDSFFFPFLYATMVVVNADNVWSKTRKSFWECWYCRSDYLLIEGFELYIGKFDTLVLVHSIFLVFCLAVGCFSKVWVTWTVLERKHKSFIWSQKIFVMLLTSIYTLSFPISVCTPLNTEHNNRMSYLKVGNIFATEEKNLIWPFLCLSVYSDS